MQQALSASNIKYLLALRSLCGPSNEIRCVSVADALGISKASVHAMMNALKEKNLIENNHYGMVHFTPEGRSLADQYAACYDVLAGYLHRVSSEEAALRAALCAFLAELPPDHLGRLC
ncbi:MAG: metal-dependent transcriptional regulator, partial [Oscillospiraceae bacterium]